MNKYEKHGKICFSYLYDLCYFPTEKKPGGRSENLPKVEKAVVWAAIPLRHEAQSHGYPLPCNLPEPMLSQHTTDPALDYDYLIMP